MMTGQLSAECWRHKCDDCDWAGCACLCHQSPADRPAA
jgi:hypothetical protein